MSTAQPVSIPPPDKILTGQRGSWARIPPRFIDPRGVTKDTTHSEKACWLAITFAVAGLPKVSDGWMYIPWPKLQKATGFERRTCEAAVSILELDYEVIESRNSKKGPGRDYRIKQRAIALDGDSIQHANCPKCKTVTPFKLDEEFVAVLHAFIENLVPALEHGQLLCMMLFVRLTMGYSKEDQQVVVRPRLMKVSEICDMTGLEPSEAESDLSALKKLGVLNSDDGKGKVKTWWVCPENWKSLKPRAKRKGGNPAPCKRGERNKSEVVEPVNPIQTTEPKKKATPAEFVSRQTATCFNCQWWGPVDLIPESENASKKPLGSANRTDSTARGAPATNIHGSWPSYKLPDWKKEA